MANKNLGLRWSHPEAIAVQISYRRIDNAVNPPFITVSPNFTTSPSVVAQNVDNGQYQMGVLPIYADLRSCTIEYVYTPQCDPLVSISAYIQSNNLIVQYLAPSSVAKVRIKVDYPNGGTNVDNYVNSSSDIVIALPDNVNGDFFVSGQSVCDEDSGFYSIGSNQVVVTRNANPTITQVGQSDTGVGGTRTQIFAIGPTVTANNRYTATVYSHVITILANVGDAPSNIAIKLRDAINNTTESQWNDFGSAPAHGTPGFPPTATASGNQLIVVLDYANSFSVQAFIS